MADVHPYPDVEDVSDPSSSPSLTAIPGSSPSSNLFSDGFSDFDLLPDYELTDIAIDAAKYKHQDLSPNVRQIRLIEILSTGEASDVCCRSSVHNLNGDPQYVALSYAWGSPPAQHIIQLDGKEFLVRKNLLRFLKHVRRQKFLAGALFWIDAICIDQSNPNERTHQVNMMPQIYKGAQKVIAWLGPAYKGSDIIMAFLSTLRPTKSSKSRMNSIWSSVSGQALAELCARSYWTRLWIFQELLLSRQTFLMCGDRVIELKIFHMLLSSACATTSRPRTKDRLAYKNTVDSPAVTIAKQITGQEVGGDRSLLGLIVATQNLSCADFRDKVYALLGVAVVGHAGILADYSVPIQVLSSYVLREHYQTRAPKNLDEVCMQLQDLCSCFEVEFNTLLALHEQYDGFFDVPPDFKPNQISAFLVPCVKIFLWAAYYHNSVVLRLILDDRESRALILEAFRVAVDCCRLSAIKVFLTLDTHVEFLGWGAKNSALMRAVLKGSHEVVEILIVLGKANVDKELMHGRHLIYYAAVKNHLEVVKTLLRFGQKDINLPDDEGYTVLQLACKNGHSEIVRLLLVVKGIEVNGRQREGRTALQQAVMNGHLEVVESLLGCPSIDVNVRDNRGRTALHLASTREGPAIAQALLAHEQVDVNVRQYKGSTALHLALRAERWAIVEAILNTKRVDVNIAGHDHATALHVAVEMKNMKVIEDLLRYPGIDVNAQMAGQGTVVHLAVQAGCLDILRVLLRDQRIDVSTQRAQGASTALHLASSSERLEFVQELLKHPEIDVNIQDAKGQTPLFSPCFTGHLDIVRSLLAKDSIDVNVKSFGECTVLLHAVENGRTSVVHALLEKSNIEVNLPCRDGYTALHLTRDVEIMKALVRRGAEINIQATKGRTPLHMALWGRSLYDPASDYLLGTGKVNVNIADDKGRTALYIACFRGKLEVVQALLKYPDLDVDRIYDPGLTAIDFARHNNFPEIEKALLESDQIGKNVYAEAS